MQQTSYRILRQFPPPEIERAWRRFLEAIDLPSHYVTPEYFLEPSIQSARPFVLVAESAGAITGILTGRYLGRNLISGMPHRPQLVLAKGDGRLPAEKALIQGLLQEGRSCRLITVYAWEPLEGFSAAGFETTETAGTFLLYLSGSAENLFQGISARKRTYIHQVKRKGVDIKDSYDIQDIDELLDVFNETHRRHRLPLRTRTELEALLKLDCNRKLFIARAEGRVIAATIIRFVRGGLAEYSENVSLERMRHYHPNEALLWETIQWSYAQGCRAFSFGGANEFKSGFSSNIAPIYRLRRDQSVFHIIDRRDRLLRIARPVAKSVLVRCKKLFTKDG